MKAYKSYIPIEISEKEKSKSKYRIETMISLMVLLNIILVPFSVDKAYEILYPKNDIKVENYKKANLINEETIKFLLDISKSDSVSVRAEDKKFLIRILNKEDKEVNIEAIIKADEGGKIFIKTIDYMDGYVDIRGEY